LHLKLQEVSSSLLFSLIWLKSEHNSDQKLKVIITTTGRNKISRNNKPFRIRNKIH
jgi:hypothetical protein